MKQSLCGLSVDNTAAYLNQLNQSNASMNKSFAKSGDSDYEIIDSGSESEESHSDSDIDVVSQKKTKRQHLRLELEDDE